MNLRANSRVKGTTSPLARHTPGNGSDSPNSSSVSREIAEEYATPLSQSQSFPKSSAHHSPRWTDIDDSIPSAIDHLRVIIEEVDKWHTDRLLAISADVLEARDVSSGCSEWLRIAFPAPSSPRPRRPRRDLQDEPSMLRRQHRRREFVGVEQLVKEDMSRAAREILDG